MISLFAGHDFYVRATENTHGNASDFEMLFAMSKISSASKPLHTGALELVYFDDAILASRPTDPDYLMPWLIWRAIGGVLNFELGTDVRPEVSTTTL